MRNPEGFEMRPPEGLLTGLPPGSKILFIRLRSLGDTILSTPLYAALKDWRPDLQLSALVEEPYDEVLRRNPDLQSVFPLPVQGAKRRSTSIARWQTLRQIRRERFHCCINLHGGTTSAWLTAMSGARYRIGLRGYRNSFCYNVRTKRPSPAPGIRWHSARFQLEWLYHLGLEKRPAPPARLFPDPALRSALEVRLRDAGLSPSRPVCVIQPSSRFYTKEWTDSGFAEISDTLQNEHGYATLLVGTEEEEPKIRRVAGLCRTRPAAIWGLSISELTWVLDQASLFLGNDSGPTHLAAALGVPVLVLFGSSDSSLWRPWQTAHEIVQNPFDCNPCPGYRCLVYDQPRCILSITPHQVKQALQRLLKRTQRPGGNRETGAPGMESLEECSPR
jgi:predicted lipopolysaccharide heptosyltransferase III